MTTEPNLFDDPDDLPELPYAGSSGWSGSSTSKDRADREDSSGITGRRQREVLLLLREARENGMTWNEVGSRLGLHHGQVSGALTGLHKTGRIVRLSESRNRSKIYALAEFTAGRPTEPYTPNSKKIAVPDGMIAVLLPPRIAEAVAMRESTSILGAACRNALETQ